MGLTLLKDAVLELAKANPDGVTNSDVCHILGLHSDYRGGSKDYLSWSVIGLLMKEGRLRRNDARWQGTRHSDLADYFGSIAHADLLKSVAR